MKTKALRKGSRVEPAFVPVFARRSPNGRGSVSIITRFERLTVCSTRTNGKKSPRIVTFIRYPGLEFDESSFARASRNGHTK